MIMKTLTFRHCHWLAILLVAGTPAGAEGADSDQALKLSAVDGRGDAVELPQPPDVLSKRIRVGKVRFEFYDPQVVKRALAGETQFEFRYSYDSRSNWKLTKKDDQPAIEVAIRYRNIKLERSHRVLLPEEMIGDDLFQRRLTLHEFDHVAISCDDRLPVLLELMLKERNAVIGKLLNEQSDRFEGQPTTEDLTRISNQFVKTASDQVFRDFVALVAIRYRELDRVSNNGLQPLSAADRDRIIDSPPQAGG